jgi:integrase
MERIKDPMESLQIHIGCYTALRVGDILSLKWEDIYDVDKINLIEHKTKNLRRMDVHHKLKEVIEWAYISCNRPHFDLHVFRSIKKRDQPITVKAYNDRLKKIFAKYRIEHPSNASHTLRKTWSQRVWEFHGKTDEALILVSDMLGHANISTTRRYIGIQGKIVKHTYLSI